MLNNMSIYEQVKLMLEGNWGYTVRYSEVLNSFFLSIDTIDARVAIYPMDNGVEVYYYNKDTYNLDEFTFTSATKAFDCICNSLL